MNVLVAGGRGFIGSNLVKSLKARDIRHSVVDLKDGFDVCKVDASSFDRIVLLAADLSHTVKGYRHNLRIYEWMTHFSAHIIYTSSAAVYADSLSIHREDEDTPAPTIYGKSKLLGEQIIKDTQKRWTIFRLGNVYGNGEGNGVIDIFKRGGNVIYGEGEDVRDYIAVEKVCEAIIKALLEPEAHNQQVYNLSSMQPRTTISVFNEYGTEPPVYKPERGFDVKYSVLDNTKAKKAGLL